MHVHVPKPLHGWRQLFGEVGVIAVGILIALVGEQVVERLHWVHEVDRAHAALRTDLASLLVDARERESEDGCIRARLGQLGAMLGDGAALPALGHIGAPALRGWQLASWPSAISSQVTTHLDRDELLALANVQSQALSALQTNERELDDWAALYAMVGPGRRLDAGEGAQLRRILADAAYRANALRLDVFQLDAAVVATKLLTAEDIRRVRHDLDEVLAGPNRASLCGPVAAPANGGVDAPYDPKVQPDPLHGVAVTPTPAKAGSAVAK